MTVETLAQQQDHQQILALLASELNIRIQQAASTVELLDNGATVPFIARYRKEATGGLDDNVLRDLEVRLIYLRDMQSRRHAILESIRQQEKLTPELEQAILAADTKQRLEDLYAPYKPKRRTRAQIAREAGLEPLADAILAQKDADPVALAEGYLNAEAKIDTAKAAWTVPATFWPNALPSRPTCWKPCATICGSPLTCTPRLPKARNRKATSSATGSTLTKRCANCLLTACWLCCAVVSKVHWTCAWA